MINTVRGLKVKVTYGSEQKYSKKHMFMEKRRGYPSARKVACVEGGKEVPRWWCPPFYLAPFAHSKGSSNGGPDSALSDGHLHQHPQLRCIGVA